MRRHLDRARVPARRVYDGPMDPAFVHKRYGFPWGERCYLPVRRVARQPCSPKMYLRVNDLHGGLPIRCLRKIGTDRGRGDRDNARNRSVYADLLLQGIEILAFAGAKSLFKRKELILPLSELFA